MTINSAGVAFRHPQKGTLDESESYLSSSSSSGGEVAATNGAEDDDGTSLTSSQHMSGGVLSQQMLNGTKPLLHFSD